MAYGASSIAYSVNKEFGEEINKIPIVNQYYNIRLVDVQNYYYRLAYARLLSEKKYVDFKESAPERLYSEDRYCKFRNLYNIEDYSNELLIANYNISFLQDYLSRDYIWW